MTADERIATFDEQLQHALEQVRLLEEWLVAAQKRYLWLLVAVSGL